MCDCILWENERSHYNPTVPPTTTQSSVATRERILDRAERLFAEHGFAGTSVRRLAEEAGVVLSSMNYHFGSKQALFQAVIDRSFAPLDMERLRLLDELERAPGEEPPSVNDLVRAMIEPALSRARNPQHGAAWLRFIGRIHSESGDHWQFLGLLERHMGMVCRFQAAFARALPHLQPDELRLRFFCLICTVANALIDTRTLPLLGSTAHSIHDDPDSITHELVNFVSAGLQAPPATPYTPTTQEQTP